MAAAIGNFLDRIQVDNDESHQIAIGSSAFAVCDTAAATADKVATMPGFRKRLGATIHIKFTNGNTAIDPTLNVQNTGASKITEFSTAEPNTNEEIEWEAGSIFTFTYDGTNWVKNSNFNSNITSGDYGIRIYNDTVTENLFNDDYPLLISRTEKTALTAASIDSVFSMLNNSDRSKIPTYNPYTGEMTVPTIIGNLEGTADVALKLTTSNLGSITEPIYLVAGVATVCSTYAGGTLVTLNNVDKGADTASFYAPITGGTANHILISTGTTSAPVWSAVATLSSEYSTIANAAAWDILTLGNSGKKSTSAAHSEGKIILYAEEANSHVIIGASDNTFSEYEHIFPNVSGAWIVAGGSATGVVAGVANGTTLMYLADTGILTQSNSTVGSNTEPVWLNSGVITALTYTANRLYYSASTTSFEATDHYANSTQLFINKIPGANETITETLYVDGTTTITGITQITDTTDITTGAHATDGALIVSGGVTINKKLSVGLATTLGDDLSVIGNSTLLGRVGIGISPDESTTGDWHQLHIKGSTLISSSTTGVAHLDVDGTHSTLTFYPETTHTGSIGLDTNRWNSLYLSNLMSIIDSASSIVLEVADITNSSTASINITTTAPTIELDTITTNGLNWNIKNESGIFTISHNNISSPADFIGNLYGYRINSRLYINQSNALTINDTLDLYINGTTELLDAVGIGASPAASDYILYINGNTQINTGDLDIFNVSNNTVISSITLEKTGIATITALVPQIILESTSSGINTADWTLKNNEGIFSLYRDNNVTLIGTANGYQINPRLYINEDITTNYSYNFYVNGTSCFAGNVDYSYNDSNVIEIDVSIPSIFPSTTNTGTLGLTSKRWSALFIGTADTYGDPYTPIYWLDGVPTVMNVVQKINWTLSNTSKSVTIASTAGAEIFSSSSIIVQIVVTSGESNINAPLTWKSGTDWIAINTSIAVSGTVTGYILVIRGIEMNDNTFTYTQSTSEV